MDSTRHQDQKMYQILMLPWLGHGHVSPFLELAKRLVAMKNKNFQVFMCSTPANLGPFRQKDAANNDIDKLIHFIDLHLPASSELPPDQHTTKNLPPDLMPVLKTAFDEAKDNFHAILRELKPDILIYDFLQPWAAIVAQEESIPAVLFLTTSAASSAFLYHCAEFDDEYPTPGLKFAENQLREMLKFMYDVSNGVTNKERYFECIERSCGIILSKTLNEIEKNHIDYLSRLVRKEIVPVGPLVQEPKSKSSDDSFMKWLDQRKDSKAVFVSFGTEYFLSKEEIEEVAYGLEQSMVSFIWVVRFHGSVDVTSLDHVLPEGFLDRISERGIVVEGWAPQAKILSHENVRSFVSHCGWSSTLESIALGVPIIAMPMHLDQPFNAKLVVSIGVGIEAPREFGELYRKEEVARVIREVVEEKGDIVRKKVEEMSGLIKEKGNQDIDHAVEKLMKIVKDKP